MCSSINELIEWIESERVRISNDYARLPYCEEWESTLYYNVNIDFLTLIRLIKTELDDEFLSDNVTEKYKNLRDNWLASICSCFGMDANLYASNLPQIIENFKIIKLFSFISKVDSTTVIIGANGSGKSSLINELRKNSIDEMYILPAQKLLYFVSNTFGRDSINKDQYIANLKNVETKYNTIQIQTQKIEDDFSSAFTKLITLWVKDFAKVMTDNARGVGEVSIALLDRVEQIWNQIFPEITFYPEANDRVLEVIRNGNKYSINGLSDGERCVLFYIGNVLLAPENSYIVVDEPETFLNAAVYNELWDLLISERSDCQFVFASHNMDFVQSRTNATYMWCKKFEAPYDLDYERLEDSQEFPLSLLTEVSGTRKPILFCEGTKTSIDYKIYSKLFNKFCFVKPVQGHKQVIQHTKAYNDLQYVHGNTAYGIIDNDWMDESSIQVYKEQGIFVLPFNEVEMILVDDAVVKSCLHFDDDKEKQQKIKNLQQSIIDSCKENKDKIISIALKKRLDEFMEGNCIDINKPTKEDVEEFLKNLVNKFDASLIVDNITFIVEESLNSSDFSRILKICNLKNEIIDYRGNTEIVPNFKDKALKRIALDNDLQKELRHKYFEELEMKLLK
ncbi:AAA family ATPase [Streptococcus mitis]|jgi:hypothetical protein|uniref:AAA family ATPase n=1 Tax=Streptococcus mitis TaxID=28037 RepID=UPI0025545962|nr:AAA family ATPase [Streptococcus mitis]MDK6636098.1 AAA family ATPase [Streptococcus mitis]MDK7132718.1 AAA family ATPase [Streptococcus mitis]